MRTGTGVENTLLPLITCMVPPPPLGPRHNHRGCVRERHRQLPCERGAARQCWLLQMVTVAGPDSAAAVHWRRPVVALTVIPAGPCASDQDTGRVPSRREGAAWYSWPEDSVTRDGCVGEASWGDDWSHVRVGAVEVRGGRAALAYPCRAHAQP